MTDCLTRFDVSYPWFQLLISVNFQVFKSESFQDSNMQIRRKLVAELSFGLWLCDSVTLYVVLSVQLVHLTISAIKMADFWKVCKGSKIHLNIAKFMTPWKPFKRSFIWNFCGTTNSMNMQMRVRLAKPLNFETAHGVFTKFHKKSQKTLPDIDKNWIDIGANTGQLAPKISSKSIKIFYHFYSSKIFQKIRVTNSALFSWGGNLVVSP